MQQSTQQHQRMKNIKVLPSGNMFSKESVIKLVCKGMYDMLNSNMTNK